MQSRQHRHQRHTTVRSSEKQCTMYSACGSGPCPRPRLRAGESEMQSSSSCAVAIVWPRVCVMKTFALCTLNSSITFHFIQIFRQAYVCREEVSHAKVVPEKSPRSLRNEFWCAFIVLSLQSVAILAQVSSLPKSISHITRRCHEGWMERLEGAGA